MDSRKMDRRFLLAGIGGAVAGSLLSSTARAGSLTPPPGQITATGQSLTEISDRIARTPVGVAEPCIPIESLPGSSTATRVITVSGSYLLTRNLDGEPNKHGLDIQADNVDVDLCGFHLNGPQGSLAAIKTDRQNVTVYDGSCIGWDMAVDCREAARFCLWDIVSLKAAKGGFFLGSSGQAYDCDCYACAMGFSLTKTSTLVEECGTWECATGFSCTGARNLLLSNCATSCPLPFEIAPGNAFGPIVMVAGAGDISAIPHSEHPSANIAN